MQTYQTERKEAPVWLVVGCIFMFASGYGIKSNIDAKNRTDSKVLSSYITYNKEANDGDGLYNPTYYYIVDGTKYYCRSRMSTAIKRTKNITVYYNSANPRRCFVDDSGIFLRIFFAIGAVLAICSIGIGIRDLNKPKTF